jgi:hypothetical protein
MNPDGDAARRSRCARIGRRVVEHGRHQPVGRDDVEQLAGQALDRRRAQPRLAPKTEHRVVRDLDDRAGPPTSPSSFRRSSSGSLAMLAAMRRASSRVSSLGRPMARVFRFTAVAADQYESTRLGSS